MNVALSRLRHLADSTQRAIPQTRGGQKAPRRVYPRPAAECRIARLSRVLAVIEFQARVSHLDTTASPKVTASDFAHQYVRHIAAKPVDADRAKLASLSSSQARTGAGVNVRLCAYAYACMRKYVNVCVCATFSCKHEPLSL